MSTQRYRKKPVEVEAVRWDGTPEGSTPILDWILSTGDRGAHWDYPHDEIRHVMDDGTEQGCPASPGGLFIRTLEGEMRADAGDWIIRGVAGEFYPCKPEIFAATYEKASAPSERIRYRPRPSERSMWVRFWLTIAFVLGVEMLLAFGLDAWWGEEARGASAAVTLTVCIVMLFVGGFALDACQSRDQWQVEE